MSDIEFIKWVEIPVKVCAAHQPEEPAERNYPGCKESVEIESIEFVREKFGVPILTMEGLKDYTLELNSDSLEMEAWDKK